MTVSSTAIHPERRADVARASVKAFGSALPIGNTYIGQARPPPPSVSSDDVISNGLSPAMSLSKPEFAKVQYVLLPLGSYMKGQLDYEGLH